MVRWTEPEDPDVLVANLRAHIEEHRQLAEQRETRLIELEGQLDGLEDARARAAAAENEVDRLRSRRSVRLALQVAGWFRPAFGLVRRGPPSRRRRRPGVS